MTLRLHRLSYALGAEVAGFDFAAPMDDRAHKEINDAFLEHHVLVFRGSEITREQHVRFSKRFGPLDMNTHRDPEKRIAGHPEFFLVVNQPSPAGGGSTARRAGEDWHTDNSQFPAPANASMLRAVEIPGIGGDTAFANMYRAYDSLSAGMRSMLDGLYGVHFQGGAYIDKSLSGEEMRKRFGCSAHPLVRVHPETGRKALYVNRQVRQIVGMTAAESRPLIDYLTEHATRAQNVYRHRWKKHDLVLWDNRCLLHVALPDFDRSELRRMERTTVVGPVSGYSYEGPLD